MVPSRHLLVDYLSGPFGGTSGVGSISMEVVELTVIVSSEVVEIALLVVVLIEDVASEVVEITLLVVELALVTVNGLFETGKMISKSNE